MGIPPSKLPPRVRAQVPVTYHPVGSRRVSKYGNTSCRCIAGHAPHHSILEAAHCNQLYARLMNGEIKSYRTQVRYDLNVNGHHISTIVVDFVVESLDGTFHIEETKGFDTEAWKIKQRLFEACYPHLKYVVIREKSHRTSRRFGRRQAA